MQDIISQIRDAAPNATIVPFRVGRGVRVKGAKDPAASAEILRWTLPHSCDVGLYGARLLISFHR